MGDQTGEDTVKGEAGQINEWTGRLGRRLWIRSSRIGNKVEKTRGVAAGRELRGLGQRRVSVVGVHPRSQWPSSWNQKWLSHVFTHGGKGVV